MKYKPQKKYREVFLYILVVVSFILFFVGLFLGAVYIKNKYVNSLINKSDTYEVNVVYSVDNITNEMLDDNYSYYTAYKKGNEIIEDSNHKYSEELVQATIDRNVTDEEIKDLYPKQYKKLNIIVNVTYQLVQVTRTEGRVGRLYEESTSTTVIGEEKKTFDFPATNQ